MASLQPKSREMYEFKKQLEELGKYRGRGTELISVYITPGYQVSDVVAKLRDEYGQASNIKSKLTQKNVQAALDRVMHALKGVNKAPEHGLAVFCGNVSEVEGKDDIKLIVVHPPAPINTQFYRCDSTFQLGPLEDLLGHEGAYGLVVIDGSESTIAVLRGKSTKILREVRNFAPKKQHHGGQSAARYQRIHDNETEAYYKRVGEAMDAFLEIKNFQGVIVGGAGPNKETFMKLKPFNYQLKILGVVDTGYSDEQGLRELVEKSEDILKEQSAVLEKQLFDKFMNAIIHDGLATYGLKDVREAIESRKASSILVTEGLDFKEFNVPNYEALNKELEDLIALAEEQGLPVEFISRDTHEGAQFHATFRGLGAFLRYK